MKTTRLVIPLICCMIVNCSMGCRPLAMGKGSLVIGMASHATHGKTISPVFDIEVASFEVSGTGPSSATFSQTGVTGTSMTQNYLAPGIWTITVDAFNVAHERVGTGSAAVAVETGKTASASIQVSPLTGTGVLAIEVSWPSGSIASPTVTASLTPAGGSAQALSFTLGTDSASWSSDTLQAGYYSITLQLSDGSVAEWGAFEAIRVLNGKTTTADFVLTTGDLLSGE